MQIVLENYWSTFLMWMDQAVWTVPFLVQLSLVLASVLVGVTAGRSICGFFEKWAGALSPSHMIHKIGVAQIKHRITLLSILLCQSVVVLFLMSTEQPAGVALVVTKLLAAWLLIRTVLVFSKSSVFTRFFSLVVWSTAALSIVGILDDTVATLEGLTFAIGGAKLSVFSLLTGLLTLVALVYGASKLSKLLDRKIEYIPNLTPSARVLVKKISRIFLLALAFMIGVNSMGIDLTALAVFGGAVGLGVGFGLQKVISNLFSGFILLLDRSIKPGDVIQIDDTFGWVNSLGTRCVSILTRDGIEYLVPNEHLITEKVTNWSYSSKNVRQKIPLGISYEADLRKAIELVTAVAKEHKRVLKDPAPVCRVTAFGDSSIKLELRIWISDPVEGVMNIRSDLLLGIWDAFKEHQIDIPFPQHDVHLKPSQALQDLLQRSA